MPKKEKAVGMITGGNFSVQLKPRPKEEDAGNGKDKAETDREE